MAGEIGRAARDQRHFTSAEVLAEGLDSGGVGVWRWEVATGKLTWSHNLESIHRLPVGTFDGTFESFARDIHADDRARVMEEIQQALATREDYRVEYRLPADETGVTRWVEARGRVIRNADGTPAVMTGICTDITSHKNAEEELALRSRQHEAVVHLGESALAGTDLKALFGDAVAKVADLISADFAEILELSQERDELVTRAGFGWTTSWKDSRSTPRNPTRCPASRYAQPFRWLSTTSGRDTLQASKTRDRARREKRRQRHHRRRRRHAVRRAVRLLPGTSDASPRPTCASCRASPTFSAPPSAPRATMERRELLIGELRHRVGNLFSLVQALHRQTGQSAVDAHDLEMKFGARLASLASAHTLILDGGWQRTSLRSLLRNDARPLHRARRLFRHRRAPPGRRRVLLLHGAARARDQRQQIRLASRAPKAGSLIESRSVPDALGQKAGARLEGDATARRPAEAEQRTASAPS